MQKAIIRDKGAYFYGIGRKNERDAVIDAVDVLLAYGLESVRIEEDQVEFVLSKDRMSEETADVHFDYVARNKKA